MIKIKLREVMNDRGYNIQQLAELTGMHRNGIAKILNDSNEGIRYDTLAKLCRALKCQVGDILEYVDE